MPTTHDIVVRFSDFILAKTGQRLPYTRLRLILDRSGALAVLKGRGQPCRPGETAARSGCIPESPSHGSARPTPSPRPPSRLGGSPTRAPRPVNRLGSAPSPTATAKPYDQAAQRHAEKNQERLALALPECRAIPGNAPSDAEQESCKPRPCHRHQFEVKTLLANRRGSCRMTSAAQARKLMRRDEGPPPPVRRQWTVIVDQRQHYAKGQLDKATLFPLYIREGTGSFAVGSMFKVESAEQLRQLLATPTKKLPPSARPPEHGFYAEWVKATPAKRHSLARAALAREQARIARKQRKEVKHGNVP